MWKVLACTALVACHGKSDDYPIGPGGPGGPGGIGGVVDAAIDGVRGDGGTFTGRVCLTADLRTNTSCDGTKAGNLTVTLGSATTTTQPNGDFVIDVPAGTNLTWHVTGAGLVTSVTQFSPDRVIVAITEVDYDMLGAIVDADKGSMVVRLVHENAPVVGATANVAPNGGTFQPSYDGPTALAWTQLATGPFGTVWLPDAAAGAQTMTITSSGIQHVEPGIVVEAGAIRYATIDVP